MWIQDERSLYIPLKVLVLPVQVIRMIIFMLFKVNHFHYLGFPGGSVVKNLLGWKDPLEEEMATYSSILAVIIPGQQNTIYEVAKSQTQLSNLAHFHIYIFNPHRIYIFFFFFSRCSSWFYFIF